MENITEVYSNGPISSLSGVDYKYEKALISELGEDYYLGSCNNNVICDGNENLNQLINGTLCLTKDELLRLMDTEQCITRNMIESGYNSNCIKKDDIDILMKNVVSKENYLKKEIEKNLKNEVLSYF